MAERRDSRIDTIFRRDFRIRWPHALDCGRQAHGGQTATRSGFTGRLEIALPSDPGTA